jgi:hypothetical protein
MSIIAAGTTTTTALSSTGNTDGTIQLQVNGTTPSVTLNTLGAVGVGASPNFGTSGQVLISGGSTAAPTWGTAGAATTATNLAGGSAGVVPYQTGAGATAFTAAGTTGQVLTSNGAAAPTWATPAPGAGTVTAVATGSLSDGSTVAVNSNGTVSVVSGVTQVLGTVATVSTTNDDVTSSAYDSTNNRVVIAYKSNDNSGFGRAVVGTVSGTSISFGSPVVFASVNVGATSTVYDSTNNRIVIAYNNNANGNGISIVGTVSGSSISFGSPVTFIANNIEQIQAVYDSTNSRVVIFYKNVSNSSRGSAIVGTVSGTSISFGSAVLITGGEVNSTAAAFNVVGSKVVVAFSVAALANKLMAYVGTVSGTSISFGSAVEITDGSAGQASMAYDSLNNKLVIAYTDNVTSSFGRVEVGTVSGTSTSWGAPVTFASVATGSKSVSYDPFSDNIIIAYNNTAASTSFVIVGRVAGTTVSFGTAISYVTRAMSFFTSVFDSVNNKNVISGRDDNGYVRSAVFQTFKSNVASFIGFSNAAYTNGQTATIQTVGSADDAQTSLTPGVSYYVQPNGTLGTTADSLAPMFAGTALTSTRILIKG